MRESRLKAIDELSDVDRIVLFKEKRLSRNKASRNYKVCELLTEEVMALKNRIESKKHLFLQKAKHAKQESRMQHQKTSSEHQ